jgi:peroxiredoxin
MPRAAAAGGCDHLVGATVPSLALESTAGPVDLDDYASELLVLFVYSHATGLPGAPVRGWDQIPGAHGCTEQSCSFRDRHDRLEQLGARVAGLSAQTVDEQREFAGRVGLRFPLLSDPDRRLAAALGLPTFTAEGRTFYRRLALIARRGLVIKVFFPVAEPERNAADIVNWLEGEA